MAEASRSELAASDIWMFTITHLILAKYGVYGTVEPDIVMRENEGQIRPAVIWLGIRKIRMHNNPEGTTQ